MFSKFPLFPEAASTIAGQVDTLYFFLLSVSAFFALLIAALIIRFAYKYRRRAPDERGAAIHGSLGLELTWSVIPFALTMVMFAWGASIYLKIARPPDDALQVFVVGKQWMWKIQHMEGRREINQLHVPLGRPVKLVMTSEDVIHSFFIPAFRVKQDAVPGRYSTLWFQPTKLGTYHLFCAEYCGTEHSKMIGQVIVMDPSDYQNWLGAESGTSPMAAQGATLFTESGCASCHRAGAEVLGPRLEGIFGTTVRLENGQTVIADEAYLRESILDPRARIVAGYPSTMPTFKGLLTEEGLLQLIEFIKSLAPVPDPDAAAPPRTRGSGDAPPQEQH